VFLIAFAAIEGARPALSYFEARDFTEPAFLFVIMVIAASRPVLDATRVVLEAIAGILRLPFPIAFYVVAIGVGPLLGSLITEPAAMTLCALLLRDRYFAGDVSERFKYATVGVLFVNISIGGVLTAYAAPPVLMVAGTWSWDTAFMFQTFGWKAVVAVIVNAAAVTFLFRDEIVRAQDAPCSNTIPLAVVAVHLGFLAVAVAASHHPLIFLAAFLFFLGFTEAYPRYQSPLILREGLMVAFFLAGLVTLGGQQEWWLTQVLTGLEPVTVFFGATGLTAIADNAALTYLGSLMPNVTPEFQYALVAGAVTGGGLTVIANAPNPAGFSILKGSFADGAIGPVWLLIAALPPTVVAICAFWLLPR